MPSESPVRIGVPDLLQHADLHAAGIDTRSGPIGAEPEEPLRRRDDPLVGSRRAPRGIVPVEPVDRICSWEADNVLTVGYVGQHSTHLMVAMPYLQNLLVNGAVQQGPYLSGNPTLRAKFRRSPGTCSCANQEYNGVAGDASQALQRGPGISGGLHVLEGHVGLDRLLRPGRPGGKPVGVHAEFVQPRRRVEPDLLRQQIQLRSFVGVRTALSAKGESTGRI